MWTPTEISAGTARLTDDKLNVSDAETLVGVFKLYLKSLSGSPRFSDLSDRVAAATDSTASKSALKLAATLILLEENGFALFELKGGRSGLQTNNSGEMVLKIRLALTMLGYNLPEEFSGAIETGDENISGSNGLFFGSTTINRKAGW